MTQLERNYFDSIGMTKEASIGGLRIMELLGKGKKTVSKAGKVMADKARDLSARASQAKRGAKQYYRGRKDVKAWSSARVKSGVNASPKELKQISKEYNDLARQYDNALRRTQTGADNFRSALGMKKKRVNVKYKLPKPEKPKVEVSQPKPTVSQTSSRTTEPVKEVSGGRATPNKSKKRYGLGTVAAGVGVGGYAGYKLKENQNNRQVSMNELLYGSQPRRTYTQY